jgi:magnesium chelatase ATPase subunit I
MKRRRLENNRNDARSQDSSHPSAYPFTAIVGQDEMKLALILNVVDPLVGGALIMGHRGTGKSTAVRALADLLPEINVVSGCSYNCDPSDEKNFCVECREKAALRKELPTEFAPVPVVELPLGATEDRVCGTIDIERALTEGRKSFDPGLLARANRGFLYVDEVNLLEDHLVDLLLDVAVTGRNKVERESVSVEHPAHFVLIGSGNPEEGELRPQLLDRFGLHAEVRTENYLNNRISIVDRRDAYDQDREAFCESFADDQDQLRNRITRARAGLRKVTVERDVLAKIAQLCADLKVDGHRGELTIMRAARALAAFEGKRTVSDEHVKTVSAMSLRHRLRRDALEETATSEQIEQAVDGVFPKTPPQTKSGNGQGQGQGQGQVAQHRNGRVQRNRSSAQQPSSSNRDGTRTNTNDVPTPPGFDNRSNTFELDEELRPSSPNRRTPSRSKRSSLTKASSEQVRGRYARSVSFKSAGARIALDATLRALVATKWPIGNTSKLTPVASNALRYKLLKHKQGTLFVFAIDTSGSMAANRIARAKSTILKLLRKSYLNRDSVAIVSFHGTSAKVDLTPSRSILRARRVLDSLNMGGSTPLCAGLVSTIELIRRVGGNYGETVVLLFTDGRSNVPLRRNSNQIRALRQLKIESEVRELSFAMKKTRARVVVVDTQREFESSEETRRLAEVLQARFIKVSPATSRTDPFHAIRNS